MKTEMPDEAKAEVFNGSLAAPLAAAKGGASLHSQLSELLRAAIQAGELRPGDPIPSEHQLCKTYGVSRPTVRRAIETLVVDGLLVKRQGMGTFVAKLKLLQPEGRVIGFSERMRRNGLVPSSRILEHLVLPGRVADPAALRALDVSPADSVVRLVRLRLANGEPVLLETIHLPLARFPALESIDFEQESLYSVLLVRYGANISYIRESLEPVILTAHEAALLWTQPGPPGMRAH
ncbi:MAG: GntR family transcriptional regulator, partial [Thermomicrobiales bacterium]